MKPASKNETAILDLINKVQVQLVALDQKLNTLIARSVPETKPAVPKQLANNVSFQPKPHDDNKGRITFSAICADCQKECKIPFKPSGDRPVYCQDCFSRRKMVKLSGIKVDDKSKEFAPTLPAPAVVKQEVTALKAPAKPKKKVTLKKSPAKKKPTPKKK